MTAHIGFVDNSGGVLAHYRLLEKIRDVCQDEGWTVLRYNTSIANRELIMRAPGLSGTKQIFCGVYCYQDPVADYYNLAAATMKGYVAGNSFATQPGISPISGVPAHNVRIDYWISVNGQRLTGVIKVAGGIYETFYIGEFFPYAPPSQYPQPLVAAGMLDGASATRYSETSHSIPWRGNKNSLRMNFNDATWRTPHVYPYVSNSLTQDVTPLGGVYGLVPLMLCDTTNIYGMIDGVFHISGRENSVENTLTIGGVQYVVFRDVWRTGFGDYFALRMD